MERADLARVLARWRSRRLPPTGREPVLVAASQPEAFMAAFADAVAGETEVFLCDPHWGEQEDEQLEILLQRKASASIQPFPVPRGWLMIPTGGSSGTLKFTRHDQDTVAAAALAFARHFSLRQVNAIGVLPLHHVSGLMAWLRSALTGGDYRPASWKEIEAGNFPQFPALPDGWVLSLVPTQLERLLRSDAAVAWLARFQIIFLGGAPAWPELLERAAAARLPVSVGYGMTETAAMTTALLPADFLAGARDNGTALPHARVSVNGEGTVQVSSASLFRGYYPYWVNETLFTTGDLGRLDERGHLTVLGRRDGVIISGGEKIQPAEVEAALRATGEFADVVVLGVPDLEWGQLVVAAHPAASKPDRQRVEQVIRGQLAPFKMPKRYVPVADWPMTATGKVNRAELARRLAAT